MCVKYVRPHAHYLWHVGDEGIPASAFPLGACEGDCDNDDECAGGLLCKQRSANEAVSGCEGVGDYRKDYCYDPNPNPTTSDPTHSPTVPRPSAVPTPKPTVSPLAALAVKTVTPEGSTATMFGCSNTGKRKAEHRAIDEKTSKYYCARNSGKAWDTHPSGLIIVPRHGQMSVVKAFRIYPANNCPDCDVVAYKLEGRVNSSSPWTLIGSGDLPWKDQHIGRNGKGKVVSSTFESADPALTSTEIDLSSNGLAFLEYKVSFPEVRASTSLYQFAEIEFPGWVL